MKKFLLILIVILGGLWLLASKANPPRESYMASLQGQPTRSIWVNSNGWHTGIIVQTSDIPAGVLPAKSLFGAAQYLEMGWGDEGFYRAEEITTDLAMDALFSDTPSVVHMVGFSTPPKTYFSSSKVLELRVTEEGLRRLLRFMNASVSRTGGTQPLGPGLYGDSRFFSGIGSYSALHTCNHWAAQALLEAGIPITPWYAATSSALMWQLARYAQ